MPDAARWPGCPDLAELDEMIRRAARGKRRSPQVARFLLLREPAARALLQALKDRSYQPGPGRAFRIHDPKPRCIFALPFRDRVVQHLLIARTLAAIERRLSPHTYACRAGKGTHRCLARAADLFRLHRHVQRLDVQKFFPSIDHQILRRLLTPLTPPELRWLADRFLDAPVVTERADFHFPGDSLFTPAQRPHGLPIGSLTSQIWANVYLSPIDHLIGSFLGLPFVRYCDDLLVFHDDPRRLKEALDRIKWRADQLRLRLHPQKTRLFRTTDPVAFLGFVLRRTETGVSVRLRQDNVRRMRRRMARVKSLYATGAIDAGEVHGRLMAWLAHASHGDTRALVRRELDRLRFVREGR